MSQRAAWLSVLTVAVLCLPLTGADAQAAERLAYVRETCPSQLSPCFTTMKSLTDWIWNENSPPTARSQAPGPQDRLLVDVGPGVFDSFRCRSPQGGPQRGWVTLRGAGRHSTKLRFIMHQEATPNTLARGPYDVHDCESLDVRDLALEGDCCGVSWSGGGSSTWTDVDIFAGYPGTPSDSSFTFFHPGYRYSFAWYDSINCDPNDPDIALHYFFNSRLVARGYGLNNVGWAANCAEVWFYGGEIRATWEEEPPPEDYNGISAAVWVNEASDFRVFGAHVRSDTGVLTSYDVGKVTGESRILGVALSPGNVFHMHGGRVTVDASGHDHTDAIAILARAPGSTLHAPDTAFTVRGSAAGDASRVLPDAQSTPTAAELAASVRSPYQWPSGPHPPIARQGQLQSFVRSATGLDLFVETDCDASGRCGNPSGSEQPHLMIYDDGCTDPEGGPWLDAVTGQCRIH